ncbi:MAG: hypothetical protein HY787_29630 [Deltaproteobacteria bacterium]|nr:hypothetical protein [Deltaproteobacteria bacterium]
MKGPSRRKSLLEKMPLDVKAELALREAVAEAMAEHKLRGHPIVIWRDGKVVSVPPEEIVVTTDKRNKPSKDNVLFVKEKIPPYSKTKK